jgi:sugar/nucleoside kinase (ribokinase family)
MGNDMIPQKKFDVIVVGELNVDLILNRIDGFPEMGKEKLAGQMTLTLGSSSAIFASNLSALGAKVAFLGKIGQDSFGDLVIESLEQKGVDTSMIIRDINLSTGATIVLNYAEDRAMVTHAGAMEHLTIEDIRPELLKQARHLHFSSCYLQPGIKKDLGRLFAMAKETGLTTSFDMQWDPAEQWDLAYKDVLPQVDVFLPNEQEILHLSKAETLDAALREIAAHSRTVVVKMGSAGSLSSSDKKLIRIPPFLNKNVVDAIGAGDSFNAGFIFKFINNASVQDCQEFGNLMGALNTTAAGGTTAFVNHDQIMQIASEKFGVKK